MSVHAERSGASLKSISLNLSTLSLNSQNIGVSLPSACPYLVVWDLETTEPIQHGTALIDMDISVLCAQKVDINDTVQRKVPVVMDTMVVWVGKGQPLEPFFKWLDGAAVHSAHSGVSFDMNVLQRHYTQNHKRWFRHASKMFDTLLHLKLNRFPTPLNLKDLLEANGGTKTNRGSQAPVMWKNSELHNNLKDYCLADVKGLVALMAKESIVIPGTGNRSWVISASRLANALRIAEGSEGMVQGSDGWLAARKGKVTASNAADLLGVAYGTDSRRARQSACIAEIRGEAESSTPNPSMALGTELEPVARALYENATGFLVKQVGLVEHQKHSTVAASPDGRLEPFNWTSSLLEIKVGCESFPYLNDKYLVQLIVQMACCSAPWVDFMALNANNLQFEVTRVYRDTNVETDLIKRCVNACEEAQQDSQPEALDTQDYARLMGDLRTMRENSVGPTVKHNPSFGKAHAVSLKNQVFADLTTRQILPKRPPPEKQQHQESFKSPRTIQGNAIVEEPLESVETSEEDTVQKLNDYVKAGPYVAVISCIPDEDGRLAAAGALTISLADLKTTLWTSKYSIFVGIKGSDLEPEHINDILLSGALAKIAYSFDDIHQLITQSNVRADYMITRVLITKHLLTTFSDVPSINEMAAINGVAIPTLRNRDDAVQSYTNYSNGDEPGAVSIKEYMKAALQSILLILDHGSKCGLKAKENQPHPAPRVEFQMESIGGMSQFVETQPSCSADGSTQADDGKAGDGPDDAGHEEDEEDSDKYSVHSEVIPGMDDLPENVELEEEMDVDVDDDLNQKEFEEDVAEIEELVGRCLQIWNGTPHRWVLVKWKDKEELSWRAESFFDTPEKARMLNEYKKTTGKEGQPDEDPQGRGWVRKVMRSYKHKGRVVYVIRWYISSKSVDESVGEDLVYRRNLANPEDALGNKDKGKEREEEYDSDVSGDEDEHFLKHPPEEFPKPVSALVWDPREGRSKVGVANSFAYIEKEMSWIELALNEWCVWRLYLLQCLAPRESSVTDNDMKQLGNDLYEIDKENILDEMYEEDDETFKNDKVDEIKRKVQREWSLRRQMREVDTRILRGQILALRAIKDSATNMSQIPAIASPESQIDQQAMSALNYVVGDNEDAIEIAKKILEIRERDGPWWQQFAHPPARMHTQTHLLSGSREVGGNRNAKQRRYLEWIRRTNSEKEVALRGGPQKHQDEWLKNDWGSPYSTDWPRRATFSNVNLEHIVCSEWLHMSETRVFEAGLPRQDATICTLCLAKENSSRKDKPLSVFGSETDKSNRVRTVD